MSLQGFAGCRLRSGGGKTTKAMGAAGGLRVSVVMSESERPAVLSEYQRAFCRKAARAAAAGCVPKAHDKGYRETGAD